MGSRPRRASVAAAENAARYDRAEAEDAELDTYVREYYGPPFTAEFVQEALQAAQYELAQQIAAASERMGQSLNPEHPQLAVMGNSMDEWLRAPAAHFLLTLQERGVPPEQIEKLMDLWERGERREAEKAYNEALAAFQAKGIRIIKRKAVDFTTMKGRTSYMHAELDDVVQAVGPELSAHGFSRSWETSQAGRDITVTCKLRHRLGHSEKISLTAQPDETGGKNAIQAIISTTTYLQRHTLKQITGVAEAGEDDDGQGGAAAPLSDLAQGWVDYIISVRGTDKFAEACREGRAALTEDRAGLIAFNTAATRGTP